MTRSNSFADGEVETVADGCAAVATRWSWALSVSLILSRSETAVLLTTRIEAPSAVSLDLRPPSLAARRARPRCAPRRRSFVHHHLEADQRPHAGEQGRCPRPAWSRSRRPRLPAPAPRSALSLSAVTITTGMCCRSGSALRCWQTSKPSMPGIINVEQDDVRCRLLRPGQRSPDRIGRDDVEVFARELRFEQLDVRQNVVDDQDGGLTWGDGNLFKSGSAAPVSRTWRRKSAWRCNPRSRLRGSSPRRPSWRRRSRR